MVVESRALKLSDLDLGYLGFFLGLRINELVMERGAAAGFRGLRESHGYLIQHLINAEPSITELANRMEVTQQAASKAVAELVGLGVVEVVNAEDGRMKRVRLSKHGNDIVRFNRRARQQVEKRLIAALGENDYNRAKSLLEKCLESLGGTDRIKSRRVRQPR
jgi:DNA-binding MarR family transcriptional regulator